MSGVKKKKNIRFESLGKKEHYNTYITGLQYDNTDGTSRKEILSKFHKGDHLSTQIDTNNTYDKSAIKLLSTNGKTVGYVPRFVAVFLKQQLNAGKKAEVAISEEPDLAENHHPDCKISVDIKD
ncbi:MAG: HIRAN domain-containing protein [Elusimicrobia bacterium]|jgi:hypothetical protein|nr:HIRAN domain-containing protein [Elusimicrobiota bacterium]